MKESPLYEDLGKWTIGCHLGTLHILILNYNFNQMKKVMVIGCGGAGKSTFSKKLCSKTKLDLIHLDKYYWKTNWEETNADEWENIVKELSAKDNWIMDGNYGRTMHIRFAEADTIIFLDYSTLKCLWRITKRTIQYRNKERPDMSRGCKERFDFKFYHYVATYKLRRRKRLINKLNGLSESKKVIILKNDNQANQFLERTFENEK